MFMADGVAAPDMAIAMDAGVPPKFWLNCCWPGAKGWDCPDCIMLGVPGWLDMAGDMAAGMPCGVWLKVAGEAVDIRCGG